MSGAQDWSAPTGWSYVTMTSHTDVEQAGLIRQKLICKLDGSEWTLVIDRGTRRGMLFLADPAEDAGAPEFTVVQDFPAEAVRAA